MNATMTSWIHKWHRLTCWETTTQLRQEKTMFFEESLQTRIQTHTGCKIVKLLTASETAV